LGSLSQEVLENELVHRELQKAYFLKYLAHASKLVEALPARTKEEVETFWKERAALVGELY
jgi:hypothetical protein